MAKRERALRRVWARIFNRKPKAGKEEEKAPLVPDPMSYKWIVDEGLVDGEGSFTSKGLRAVLDAVEKQQEGPYKILIGRLVLSARRAFQAAHGMQGRISELETEFAQREAKMRQSEKAARAVTEGAKSGAAGEIRRAKDEMTIEIEKARTKAARYMEEAASLRERIEMVDTDILNSQKIAEDIRQRAISAWTSLATARGAISTVVESIDEGKAEENPTPEDH